ncbi:MAG: universal stress protein [Nitrospira defluvii]|nr:universal stress protein [Nitrospira defluvii]
MRAVVAVDWSEQSFNAVKVVCRLFTHEELTLIHAVDLRPFENPLFAQPLGRRSAEELRQGMVAAGERLLEQTGALIPLTVHSSLKRVCKIGNPAPVVLESIRSSRADLVAVGSRGRGRLAELILGSVSHRVVLHAPCAALLVKDDPGTIRRVLLTVEGQEDSLRLATWLSTHRFNQPVELSLLNVVPTIPVGDAATEGSYGKWAAEMEQYARELVQDNVATLRTIFSTVTAQIERGDPAQCIAKAARHADLVIVGSHGWKGLEHFLLGSVSHAVLHKVACPVLVIR